jgi:hypothetical protein
MVFSFSQFNSTGRKVSNTILLLLFFLVPGVACATIYECRKPDGVLFLTNIQHKIPPDCQQPGVLTEESRVSSVTHTSVTDSDDGGISSRQAISPQANQPRPESPEQTTASSPETTSGMSQQIELQAFQTTAQRLVASYETMQESNISASEKAAALEKLEKYVWALRQSLDSNNIQGEEREKIEAMLSPL